MWQEVKAAQDFLNGQSFLWWWASQQGEVILEPPRDKNHSHRVSSQVVVCINVYGYTQVPLVWLLGAVSGGPGLLSPCPSRSGPAVFSQALRSELPAWGPGPCAGHRSPQAFPESEQLPWVRMGTLLEAEWGVWARQWQHPPDNLRSPVTNVGKRKWGQEAR